MITEYAKVLSKVAKHTLLGSDADRLMIELTSNCKPTAEEFSEMMSAVALTPKSMFIMVMTAPKNWKTK